MTFYEQKTYTEQFYVSGLWMSLVFTTYNLHLISINVRGWNSGQFMMFYWQSCAQGMVIVKTEYLSKNKNVSAKVCLFKE